MRARDLAAPANGIATASIALAQLGIPDAYFWTHMQPGLIGSVAVLAVTSLGGLGNSITTHVNAEKIASFRAHVEASLTALTLAAGEAGSVDFCEVGAHAFLAKRKGPGARLANIGGVRVNGYPIMHNPRWKSGKGIVGLSFKSGSFVPIDWGAWSSRRIREGRAAWDEMSKEQRYGLNWGELQLSRDYQAIMAHPIHNSLGVAVGVVAIDGPVGLLNDPGTMETLLSSAAANIAGVCPPPTGWWSTHG
jgi:hypothetical protein